MKTLNLQQAAELLRIHPVTLQVKAKGGEIPGAKIGKCWVFVEVDLIEFLRSQYPRRTLQGEQEKSPCHRIPKFRLLPEPSRRIRWITREESQRLIDELPDHLKAMVRFSLETGLRQANVTGLQWSQVDLTRRCAWIHPDQAKARRAIAVPLSNAAVVIIRAQVGKHDTQVFSYQGKPVREVNTKAWRRALERAGIEDFRWHDLRHMWASWHVQAGTPLHVLQELGGWESVEMVRRYAHLSSEHLAGYVEKMSGLRVVESEKPVTISLRSNN